MDQLLLYRAGSAYLLLECLYETFVTTVLS